MTNLFAYQIASAGFFAVIFFANLVKKQLPTRRTGFFQLFLCYTMISSVLAIGVECSTLFVKSTVVNEFVRALFITSQVMCCLQLHSFVLSVAYKLKYDFSTRSPENCFFVAGCIYSGIVAVLMLLSPWTHWCFSVDQNGAVVHTPVYIAVVSVLVIVFIYDLFAVWYHCQRYSIGKRMMCSLLIIVFAITAVAEIFGLQGIAYFKIAVVYFVYMFYLSQQSPDFFVDNATGTFNRNGFIEIFKERVAYEKETSCLIVRVRNYHSMTQIYGSEILRTVQRKIGKLLVQECRGKVISHIGSSTFAIITESESASQALYEKLKEMVPETWTLKNQVVNQEYSYYAINYPADGDDFEELIQRIHYARSDHESVHEAGALVHLRSDVMEQSDEKREVAHLVEEAIMDDSIELNFQPIFSFEKGKITSLEVLARLKDKNKKYINPEFFIHVAEENHTIIQLGEQIFRKACIFASYNHIFDYGIEDININLSPAQCRYEHLTEDLVDIAARYGIPMTKMHLEITESEFTDKDAVSRTLSRLKETGAKVALDDFGTGNSTLSNILELPVDFVKIDKSLVWSFAEGKNQFLNDLMPMIKAEGKKIIAEGIETTDHIEIIKKLQGDYLQGYYYSKPLPEEEFMRFLIKFNGRVEESGSEMEVASG